MGCVIGKTASGDVRKPAGASASSGRVEEPSDARKDARRERERRSVGDLRQQPRQRPPVTESVRRKPSLRPMNAGTAWPSWLSAVAGDAIEGWKPRRADSFEKLDKIGQGTYSNVYKARDLVTGKIVAMKKVRFDNLEPESVKFMAREILMLRRLDHPNVIKLEGLVTSRMSCSLYLVFEYMEHDLAGLAACTGVKFTEPQVKCYMKQLFSGLEHCHNRGVLHRDIKGSNLLLDNQGILKIADFGLASFYDPHHRQPMTSRVVTLWYRPPELLLGATYYDVGVDLWSAGCILAELLAGKPVMPGRTEVEQLHKIFKLCGSPSEDYWKKSKLPHATLFKPQQPYKRCIAETFKDFPPSALSLTETLLAIDPSERRTATDALESEFFNSEPYACDPSSLPQYPPSKELDAKLRDEETRRQRGLGGKGNVGDGTKKARVRDRGSKAMPAPEANAELQINLDRRRYITQGNAKSKSEKFPPPHQDGSVGFQLDALHNGPISFGPPETSFASSIFGAKKDRDRGVPQSGPLGNPSAAAAAGGGEPFWRMKAGGKEEHHMAPSRTFIRTFKPSSIGISMDLRRKGKSSRRAKGKEAVSEVCGDGCSM
ncbi:hypothetical protein MRB53_027419 [Persea americana]|uniref:Uncharacterized protein n=1 Tax=Persea americana TaxID=3435 RepID=A0ACC2LLK0_PERAE|nr:hypothetical protein MRB53_027419 [Persea americana]|eukprot:TRINITY_DN5862_c0_g2_i1.p1 TRINITY_DN5862_c0_g2~~TRINITY_DN5862_c0_g2_i1.p1  ORF type:complete len:601 (+),score=102.73 TRINITY_DN5862_c0_g2_i1:449-2251(+)